MKLNKNLKVWLRPHPNPSPKERELEAGYFKLIPFFDYVFASIYIIFSSPFRGRGGVFT
jgi:hypothetical protein